MRGRGERVLVLGATGFVGRHLVPELEARGHDVLAGARDVIAARVREPGRRWVHADLDQPDTLAAALEGVATAYYLVHGMAGGPGYELREREGAERFVHAAAAAGVGRIVYLGGVRPAGAPSPHLRSRLTTGAILRGGGVPTLELRASMIIGAGGGSWRIVRDLSARLPFMVLPRWLQSRSQPIAIADVVGALADAAALPPHVVGVYDLPGPEILAAADILRRVSRILGTRLVVVDVPLVTPRLSSYWIQLVTRADMAVARELVEGLRSDLVSRDRAFWTVAPRALTPFDDAARAALAGEEASVSPASRRVEHTVRRIGLHQRAGGAP